MRPIYSAVFFNDKSHMTYEFRPGGPRLPSGITEDTPCKVKVVGYYEDDEVKCDIVTTGGLTHQPSGTLLHITRWTAPGVKPVESGKRATQNGYTKKSGPTLKGTWGFFYS